MRAYVINLPGSLDRRDHVRAELERAGIEYVFIEAVNGKELTSADRAVLVDEGAVAAAPGWLTPGAIGCALSHWLAYDRLLADEQDHALVLEDDVILDVGLPDLLPGVAATLRGAEVALLHFRSFEKCRLQSEGHVALPDGVRIMRPLDPRQPIAASGYVISAAAAKRLHDAVVPVSRTADSWGDFIDVGALDGLWCVLPRPIAVRSAFPSTIDYVQPTSRLAFIKRVAGRRRAGSLRAVLSALRWLRDKRMARVVVV